MLHVGLLFIWQSAEGHDQLLNPEMSHAHSDGIWEAVCGGVVQLDQYGYSLVE